MWHLGNVKCIKICRNVLEYTDVCPYFITPFLCVNFSLLLLKLIWKRRGKRSGREKKNGKNKKPTQNWRHLNTSKKKKNKTQSVVNCFLFFWHIALEGIYYCVVHFKDVWKSKPKTRLEQTKNKNKSKGNETFTNQPLSVTNSRNKQTNKLKKIGLNADALLAEVCLEFWTLQVSRTTFALNYAKLCSTELIGITWNGNAFDLFCFVSDAIVFLDILFLIALGF